MLVDRRRLRIAGDGAGTLRGIDQRLERRSPAPRWRWGRGAGPRAMMPLPARQARVRGRRRTREHVVNTSFENLVSAQPKRLRDGEAQRLRCLHVQDEPVLGRLLDGELGRLGALEDLVHVDGGPSKEIVQVWAIRHQAAGRDRLSKIAHQRQTILQPELGDQRVIRNRPRALDEEHRAGTPPALAAA